MYKHLSYLALGQRVCDALLLTMLTKKKPWDKSCCWVCTQRCLFSIGAFVIVIVVFNYVWGSLSLSLSKDLNFL